MRDFWGFYDSTRTLLILQKFMILADSDIKNSLQKLWHELKRCDCTECFQINAKTNAALKLFNCLLLVVPKRSIDMLLGITCLPGYICHRLLLPLAVTSKEIRQTPIMKIYHNKRYLLTTDRFDIMICNLDFRSLGMTRIGYDR